MARGRARDPRIAMMATAYLAILASVPTVLEPGEHGPLNTDEVEQAKAWMDRTAAEIRAERERG
jgi:hypothetical protein